MGRYGDGIFAKSGLEAFEATQMAYQKDQHILWLPSRISSGPGFQSLYTHKKVEKSSAEH